MCDRIDPRRLAKACELLSRYASDGDAEKWRGIYENLVKLGWHEAPEVTGALVGAPAEWLREIGLEPPEDALVRLKEEGALGLEIAYRDGSVRRIDSEELGLIALVIEAMRLFPGSSLATEMEAVGQRRWGRNRQEVTA